MPVRDRVVWGPGNPFRDPRLANLPVLVRNFRQGYLPLGWRGNGEFKNWHVDLPLKGPGYYNEFYLGTSAESASLRIVLGKMAEVYITGNHYFDFRQVIDLPPWSNTQ
jgi:guanyl-specific ribonuclease Sa